MSTRKTKSESEIPTSPAPRKRKTAAADSSAPKTTRSRRKVTTAPETSEATDNSGTVALTHEAIATRAYFIAVERGGPGDPVADWLLAEEQLRRL